MLNLNKYNKTKKKFKSGLYPKYTFDIDGTTYFFKINTVYDNVYVLQDVIEVFSSEFYKAIGFNDYVQYQFAKSGNEKGCLCKSYLTKDTIHEFSFDDVLQFNYYNEQDKIIYPLTEKFKNKDYFVYENAMEKKFQDDGTDYPQYFMAKDVVNCELKKFCDTYNIKIDKIVDEQLNKMITLDYFTCNIDRNWTNFKFLIKNEKNPHAELAPLFDNGYNFGILAFYRNKTPENTMFMNRLGFSEQGMKNNLKYSKLLTNGGIVAVDIYELAKKNPEIKKLVQNVLNVDIEKLVEKFEEENNLNLDNEVKTKICGFFNHRRNEYIKTTSKLENKLKIKEK